VAQGPQDVEGVVEVAADGGLGARAGAKPSGPGGSAREAVVAGLIIAPIWFLCQWSYSAGVARTSVTSSTVISATSVVWTLAAAYCFAGERLGWGKCLGVLACLAGNALTQVGDTRGGGGHMREAIGDLLCLASAMGYAAYTTILKRRATEETSVPLLFAAIGIFTTIVGAPVVLLFDLHGLLQMTPKVFGVLVFNGIFDNVLSQYAWAKAVQWTSPTAATVGLSLTIPLSILADFLRGNPPHAWSICASVLVVIGFVAVTLAARPAAAREAGREMPEDGPTSPLSRSDLYPATEGLQEEGPQAEGRDLRTALAVDASNASHVARA